MMGVSYLIVVVISTFIIWVISIGIIIMILIILLLISIFQPQHILPTFQIFPHIPNILHQLRHSKRKYLLSLINLINIYIKFAMDKPINSTPLRIVLLNNINQLINFIKIISIIFNISMYKLLEIIFLVLVDEFCVGTVLLWYFYF